MTLSFWLRAAHLLIILFAGRSAAADDTHAALPLFADRSTLNVRIEGPLDTMVRERSETDYYEGKFFYTDDSGIQHELDLKFRARGDFRRRMNICRFPPVRLNFRKKQVSGTVFEGQDKLKLVTHCQSRSRKYEQYVLKEYLAYRILEQHTPFSFKTRLLRITWVDTEHEDKTIERYGFVVEHENEIADRLGASAPEISGTEHSRLNKQQASIVSVFQYLIGNTDYSLVASAPQEQCCHNVLLILSKNDQYLPIPFDFDFSGIVDAAYAEPNPRFRLQNVRQRLYRGDCSVSSEIPATIDLFLENQEKVINLIANQEGLFESARRRTLHFIKNFYEVIANPQQVESTFVRKCPP